MVASVVPPGPRGTDSLPPIVDLEQMANEVPGSEECLESAVVPFLVEYTSGVVPDDVTIMIVLTNRKPPLLARITSISARN